MDSIAFYVSVHPICIIKKKWKEAFQNSAIFIFQA